MKACKQNNHLFFSELQYLTCLVWQVIGFRYFLWEMEFTALGVLLICLINLSYLLFRVWVKLTLQRANFSSSGDLPESSVVNLRQITVFPQQIKHIVTRASFSCPWNTSLPKNWIVILWSVFTNKRTHRWENLGIPSNFLIPQGSASSCCSLLKVWGVFFATAVEADLNKSNWTSCVRT